MSIAAGYGDKDKRIAELEVDLMASIKREEALLTQIGNMRAENAELRKDAARLDWIEAQHTLHRSVELLYVVDGYEVEYLYDGNSISKPHRGDSLRAAIDAAMGEQT
jgi:hypothetical protein